MDKYDAVEIAKKLISFPSVTPEDHGVQAYIVSLLSDLGFECHHLRYGDVNNLFARLGSSGPHICYLGHTDVVPPGPLELWAHDPFEPVIQNGALYGRGASDMKGSIACFISAVHQYLNERGPLKTGSISLLITGDEEGPAENGSVKVIEWMQKHGHMPDVALVGEPTNPDHMGQEIKIGRRGSLTGRIKISGKQGHVAYPHLADNPLPRLARIISQLQEYSLDRGDEYFQPSHLEFTHIACDDCGGNVIPATAQARFNIRFNNNWTCRTLEKKIRDILDETGNIYDLHCHHGAEAFITTPGAWSDLVRDAVASVTGKTPSLTTSGGTSDARFIAPFAPVIECGAVNATIHQIDEHARIEDLSDLSAIYLRILYGAAMPL